MEDDTSVVYSISKAVDYLCQKNSKCASKLGWLLSKQIWSPSHRSSLMESLTQLFLDPLCTEDICCVFQPFILDVAERCRTFVLKKGSENKIILPRFAVALSLGLSHAPDLRKISLEFLNSCKPFSQSQAVVGDEPTKKKKKREKLSEVELCEAMWRFVQGLGDGVGDAITLDMVVPHLSHHMPTVRWYAAQTIAELLKMSASQRGSFLATYFTEDEKRQLAVKFKLDEFPGRPCTGNLVDTVQSETKLSYTMQGVVHDDFADTVVEVAGILLPKLQQDSQTSMLTELVSVPSMMSNLRSLALAVVSGAPVLLQGPVGSGKTTLVEHLASRTGRHSTSKLLKIQLGDQTDSKALLGTYRCTEVPGEFVWQPGILTRAVTEGLWVLLEDIDFAPMDVVSILLPLLETGSLTVLGHGDNVKAHPGFRLFATQRLVGGMGGWHRQRSGSSLLLEKMWTRINVEPLSRQELKQVIVNRFPKLSTVVDKLLDIYLMLSVGKHDNEASDSNPDTVGRFHSLAGRLVSTRDLMTWVSRVSHDFDVSSTDAGPRVFQEALDCFVSCLPKQSKRLPLAEAIGSKLNVSKVKAEFYTLKYKPNLEMSDSSFTAGRVVLPRKQAERVDMSRLSQPTFAYTCQSVSLLEKVGVCVSRGEPVLLVGETGTGKTSSVQFLAHQLGHRLHVINLNQQSDSTDLLGGFKPVDLKFVIMPFREDFEILFLKTFSRKQNAKFLGHVQECFARRRWADLLMLMEHTQKSAVKKFQDGSEEHSSWSAIGRCLRQLQMQVKQIENALAFSFIEGTLVKALRSGDWVLLDEINLAAAETLECLSGLLESSTGSVVLTERGDIEPIIRHSEFRLFACMNPATDVGKKDLTPGIRNRFTELYVDELEEPADLKILVNDYLKGLSLSPGQVDGIVRFYLTVRTEAVKHLTDGTGHKPHFSLRTLCRALKFASSNPCGLVARSLYEGFCLSFLTQLDRGSHPVVEKLVCQHVVGKANIKAILSQKLPQPVGGKHLNFEGYWISQGTLEPHVPEHYILTPSVRENLRDLARIISAGQHPVLLQGETSVGKTSLITWLAQSTGNPCVRVNNHEHTDLQEYVGCYAADETGKLVFKEGVLVEAMRKGHWIILDELNLAPTDVLEALNRLLDDNRELFIPETQETVKAHPKFMLFATQNPPGLYGGRKMLSRAFRNRFVELHFSEIPSKELETILHQRCNIPLSYAKRLVSVMLDLQMRRRGSGVFAGKQGFMTLRDLFRWAERYSCSDSLTSSKFYDWDQHLADHGYMLLAGRVRKVEESMVIQEVLKKHLKRDVNPGLLFDLSPKTSTTTAAMLKQLTDQSVEGFQHIVWTHNMRRLAVLIGQAIAFKEPVLLVGETGCGKTTMCQMFATVKKRHLYSVNCHLHTESADFLGGLRPVRSHSEEEDPKEVRLFEWLDGPLVRAMKEGSMFLIDEISLADDSVLERLNSVLEPERTLLLAEKGGGDGGQNEVQKVKAIDGFHVFSTMNPGGDFGKKELSPALRNRFTEIWCPQLTRREDLEEIIEHNISEGIQLGNQQDGRSGFGAAILDFIEWFSNNEIGKRCTVSIRDILTWVNFINTCARADSSDVTMETDGANLEPAVAYIHGACLVFLDGLGSGLSSRGSGFDVDSIRDICFKFLVKQITSLAGHDYTVADLHLSFQKEAAGKMDVISTKDTFSIPPFSISKGDASSQSESRYALQAPTTCLNAQRVLRALQLPRPLLLEGSPGVGKTSLVSAIARSAGRDLVRINLSEQTDVTDLFGADLPVEGAEGGRFAWRDGPLLQALKAGHWVVLDELNLASQSVLEGLNACLDHRAEVFIPELGRTFTIQHEKTRLFACQNPLNQGGGRKGLPRSLLNRFTQVYVEPLSQGDLMFIASAMYPSIPYNILSSMVDFNMAIHRVTMVESLWGHRGGPWEFNLRDLFRWCDLLLANQPQDKLNPGEFLKLVYSNRMRTLADRTKVADLYKQIFSEHAECPLYAGSRYCHVGERHVQIGHSFLTRVDPEPRSRPSTSLQMLHHHLDPLESIAMCAHMNWMAVLVGPQSCGKTSVVRLLAELTGNTLHVLPMNSAMDTTELLGGFEQEDIFRHVEEVGSRTAGLVKEIQRELLCYHPTLAANSVKTLQTEWANYTQSEIHGATCSPVEEFEGLRSKVKIIQSTVVLLDKICHQNNISLKRQTLEEIRTRITHLAASVSKTSQTGGSTGGTFEWVDSLLVTALQSGHWLLIDNVNFCSPSVLDRLNALLEPGGELSINERGVIDGKIPTITPHPRFRLFLAMDPKFGEISRAMRNRGIEIYMPGEEDHLPYSSHDTKQMMKGLGLVQKQDCDWLINLHSEMKERLPRNEQPMIVDLLCVTVTTVQQLERGVTRDKALYHAANDVYVRSLKTFDSKQTARTILSEHMSRLGDVILTLEPGLWPLSMCGSQEYVRNPALANITNQGAALCFLIGQIISPQSSEEKHETAVVTRLTTMLRASLKLFISRVPQRDWQMGSIWLATLLSKLLENMKAVPSEQNRLGWKLKDYLEKLPEVLSLCLKKLSEQPISMEYRNALSALCGEELEVSSLITEQPWQVEWNPHMIQKLEQLSTSQTEERNQLVLGLQTHSHKICLLTHMTVLFRDMQPLVDKLKDYCLSAPYGSSSTATALLHLNNMVEELETGLSALVEGFKHLSEDKLNKLLSSLPWLCRLLCVTQQWRQTSPDSLLCQLSLHWNWFYNKTLQEFTASQGLSSSSTKLSSAIAQLQRVLGQDNMAAKRFERFWEGFGHPPACVNETEAELSQQWREILNLFSMYEEAPAGIVAAKVKAMTQDGYQVRKKMLDVAELILNRKEETDTVAAILEEVKSLLKGHGLVLSSEMDTDSMPDPAPSSPNSVHLPVSHVELWPLFDHLSLLSHLAMISGVPQSSSSHLSHLMDFTLCYTPDIPINLKRFEQSPEDQRGLEILLSRQVLDRLWTSPAARNPEQWLLWNRWREEGDKAATSQSGPGVFQMSSVTNFAFHLLSHDHIQSEAGSLPVSVPLSRFDDLLDVFSLLSRHLWCHAATLARPENNIRSIATQFLLKNFLHMLQAVETLLPPEDKAQCAAILNDLHLAVEQGTLTGADVRQTHSCFQCVADSLDSTSVPVISRSFEVIQDLVDSRSKDETNHGLKDVGRGLVYVGLAQMILLAPRGPVDPMEKQAVKLQHVQDELSDVEAELEVIDMQMKVETGRGLEDSETYHSQPWVRYLLTRRDKLQVKKTCLENTQVYRPQSSQFFTLAQDVRSFMESVGSTNHITALLSKLLTLHQSIQDGRHDSVTRGSCVQEERVWQVTLHKFVGRLEVEYQLYRDLLEPFMLAVQQVSLGIRFICQEVDTMANKLKFDRQELPEQTVSCLSRFPAVCAQTPSMLHLSELMVADVTAQTVRVFCSYQTETQESRGKENEIQSRLLMNALQQVSTHCLTSQELSPRVLYSLSRLFAACLQAWQDQETRRREREDEKEALYKYKARTHGDERSEDEQLEDDFRNSFPSYVKDFEDVTGKTSLEGSGDDADDVSEDLASAPDSISESEMSMILDTHKKLFTTLTETSWIEKADENLSSYQDYVISALSRYSVGAVLGKMGFTALNNSLDTETLGGHLLVCGAVETSVRGCLLTNQDGANPLAPALSSTFNIYTDPHVAEVIQCRPVLDRFSARIVELQQEWPDHPTLKMLENIVQRVLSFPVTSPIMKFLAGLELLLEKSQDWEANAAAHVSMATQLADVTRMIIQWRKLELSCWSRSLDTEMEKMKTKASRWWFHIYQLVMSYLDPHQHHLDTEEQNSEPTAEDVLKSLEQFLETSSLGEFRFRLQMIYAFHCQLANMDSSDKQSLMMNMLWNVHKFYSQFLENVEADLTRQRTPIEKELKGFVKIARWNDMNYWALKQTTEKTHRTVHKHSKAFQTILQQPVQGLLTERTEGGQEDTKSSMADRLMDVHNLSVTGLKVTPVDVPSAPSSSSGNLQLRLPTLTLKIRKHWRTILSKIRYTQLITVLDEFTGEIIESVHELQAEEVTPGLEKEKQRSEAKLMNLRKRKALSDLFKHLALTGLSYRKGLTMCQEVQKGMMSAPLDVHAAFRGSSSPLCPLWEDCHKYFYRCVARKARLDVALHTPSKDLGIGNIDRCRGFVEHLMHILMGQQTSLAAMFDRYLQLRKITAYLYKTRSTPDQPSLPPQKKTKEWIERVKTVTMELLEGLSQFQILLYACPPRTDSASVYPSPYPPSELSPLALVHQGDELWCQCVDGVTEMLAVVQAQQETILNIEDECYQWSDVNTLKSVIKQYRDLIPSISRISSKFQDPVSNTGSCLNQTLVFLQKELETLCQQFMGWEESVEDLRESIRELCVKDSRTRELHSGVITRSKSRQMEEADTKTAAELNSGVVTRSRSLRGHGDSELKGSGTKELDLDTSMPRGRSLQGEGDASGSVESEISAEREKFSEEVESLIAAALLAVQDLVKAHGEATEGDMRSKEEGEEEESSFKEGHLTKLLVDSLSRDVKLLQYNKVTEFLGSLTDSLKSLVDSEVEKTNGDSQRCLIQLLRCYPMMQQYQQIVEYFIAQLIGLFRTTGKLLSVLLGVFTELATKGFCIPPEFTEEVDGEGATDFEDITGGGLGEGQGAKDVSDQIESEDQLDETRQQGAEQQDKGEEPDVAPEDNAIEMSENFEGKMDDAEMKEGEDSDQEEPDKDELDKQIGDLDSRDADRLDEQMWGSDDEEEETEEQEEEKEESGPGAGQESETQVVAKDDNEDKTEADDNEKSEKDEKKDGEEENREEQKPHELDEFDENEYDEDKVDPHHGNQGPEQEPEALDLPEDLNLDENEAGKEEEETGPPDVEPDEKDGGGEEMGEEEQTDVPELDEQTRDEEEEKNMEEEKEESEGKEKDCKEIEEGEEEKKTEEEEQGKGDSGISPQDEESPDAPEEEGKETEDSVETAEERGKTSHETQDVEMTDAAQDEAATGDSEQKEQQGTGVSQSEEQEGHEGEKSTQVTEGGAAEQDKQFKRRPGQSDEDRSLGSRDEKFKKLKTIDRSSLDPKEEKHQQEKKSKESSLYEHIKDSSTQHDAQTLDVASTEQQEEQPVANQNEEEEAQPMGEEEDLTLLEDLKEEKEKSEVKEAKKVGKDGKQSSRDAEEDMDVDTGEKVEVEGEIILTHGAQRGPDTTIHTALEHLHIEATLSEVDEEKLRAELEENVATWCHQQTASAQGMAAASEAWQQYDALTSNLAQELCEQLRLVLEPSQATKLRGDYRTGKRLNMRKVIPYIASQFRKDKIWLRRTKPSKRQYQIMLAIDDSSSMVDNHSKQLAFESLALISNALTLLESGELAVCSFGESVRQLHSFTDQFTNQSGASILQHFTFEQKKTKIAQLLRLSTSVMLDARKRQHSGVGHPETSQLLLIVSDGRGLFNEGMEVVQSAVRQAREANIFLVFVIIDNPRSKDSILDIKVPVFKGAGQLPEIKSYMESFPFPFYIILRDINSLPQTLSDSLRQWFELVTASDRT